MTATEVLAAGFLVCGLTALACLAAFSHIMRKHARVHKRVRLHYERRIKWKRGEMARQAEEITRQREAIQKMIYGMNHQGIKPRTATLRGLLNPLILHRTQDNAEVIAYIETLVNELDDIAVKTWKDYEHLQ